MLRCLVNLSGYSNEIVDTTAKLKDKTDDRGEFSARHSFAMLINPAVSISANLEECVAVAPLDVRARLQLRQVNILPLAALGLVLDRGDCVVIVGNLNEVAVGPFCALDIDFNGNGLAVDGNRYRVVRVYLFIIARSLYPVPIAKVYHRWRTSSTRMANVVSVGQAGLEPATFLMCPVYSRVPSPIRRTDPCI